MTDRLSRKEIKHDIREDQFRQSVAEGFKWTGEHIRMIVGAAVIVLLVIAAVFGWRAWQQGRERAAGQALADAMEIYAAPVGATAPPDYDGPTFPDEDARRNAARQAFEALRAEHGGTGAAEIAAVYLGRILVDEGQTEQARTLWQEFVDAHEDHMLASTVKVSLIHLDRAAGRAEEVARELQAAISTNDTTLPIDVALYELGVTQQSLDRPDEARATFQRLADEHPESPYAAQASARLRELPAASQAS